MLSARLRRGANRELGVNLFVDHGQVVQLECLRSGVRGTQSLWGYVVSYKR